MTRVSIATTMRGYHRSWLGKDTVAALALISIAIPEQIATARLAGMPALIGMYAFIAGSIGIAIFGVTRQMSVGADSTVAPVFASVIILLAPVDSVKYQHLVSLVAILAGIFVVLSGLLRMGWVADLMSTPIVDGILAGIAVDIAVGQLPNALGIKRGGTTLLGKFGSIARNIGGIHPWSLAIAAGVILVVFFSERIDRRIPGPFIALVASILIVPAFGLKGKGVSVLGVVKGGLPSLGLPPIDLSNLKLVLGAAVTVAYVTIVQTAATSRLVASSTGEAPDVASDLVGVGVGSLIAGATGGFAVDASPPRSAVIVRAGGKSQMTSLIAAAAMLLVALVATGLITDLPNATLAAILMVVATRLLRIKELRSVLHYDKVEFVLAVAALLAVALLGVEEGVIVAILFSLAYRTKLAARPKDRVLLREVGTDHWVERSELPTEQVPGVLVYLITAPLWFGNAQFILRRILAAVAEQKPQVDALVIDAAGIEDIDFTGAEVMVSLDQQLQHRGIKLVWARMDSEVEERFRGTSLGASTASAHFFVTVQDAVEAVDPKRQP